MASHETFDIPIGKVVGPKGDTGTGIKSIKLLSTSGLVKTYRITMTDDTTFDFVVTDGNGITGASFDAQTNALTLTFDNGTSFTTPSLKGVKGDTGNGISRIEKTGTEGLVDTYTVTYTNGQTYTYTVTNGADGVSPTVTVETITDGHRVTITDKDHPTGQSFDVMDGASDAGNVSYDETATYQSGTVGAELQHQSRQINHFDDNLPGTVQTVNFGADGKPSSVVHTKSGVTVRTDSFTWGDGTVTETRTTADGSYITMVTDLSTLVTTISEIQEAS